MDREEKKRAAEERRKKRAERHIVTCPHCGGRALDHMTVCPNCGGELSPLGYRPLSEKTRKRMRIIGYVAGAAVAVAVVLVIFLAK